MTSSPHFADLDNTTVGKAGLNAVSRVNARPTLSVHAHHPFHHCSIALPGASCRYELCRKATQMHHYRSVVRGSISNPDEKGAGRDDELPPMLKDDPRDFRARLVAAERAATADHDSTSKGPGWMYETTLLEQGSVLLGAGFGEQAFGFALRQQYFHKCVILLLVHDTRFTKGIILNRPTELSLDGWPVWLGGDVDDGGLFRRSDTKQKSSRNLPEVTCLHRLKSESVRAMSTCVIKDIYHIPFDYAKELVARGDARKEDFWIFAGYAGWAPGQLQGELERGSWYSAAADSAVLLDELLTLAASPRSLPSVEAAGLLSEGGDGLGTWERLAANIGRKENAERDFADRMLRQWVLSHLTLEGQKRLESKTASIVTNDFPLHVGTVLASSSVQPFLLENQYLHKSILIVLEVTDGLVVAAVLNRPRLSTVLFPLPGKGPNAGKEVKVRVSFGGQLSPFLRSLNFGQTIMPLHHKRELGGLELGDSGVFIANQDFTGEARDLMVVSGLLVWAPPSELQRLLQQGTFTIVSSGKVPWEQVWELGNAISMQSASLQERIADVKRTQEGELGELSVLKDRAVRMAKRSCEVWDRTISETGSRMSETSELEAQLADEALFEWCRMFRLAQ
eukprot:gnl/MRDRNA2_/MRDRNA2_88488_c0_seq1.p1 gnl/MRDRNA2_/MRDRNA2_88488_c0~~gnl/MRDRNA2_/MRDRNA2_88488_c0_seq1.p1  ORF type:complete len:674 (+),score=116.13 gnl/MRDRNA2_/MRDRNA2_88488_c0_seq1:156-2024(+)